MSFGLCNAAKTFQRHIDEVLRGLHVVFVYIDDILVASRNQKEHEKHLTEVLQRLHEHHLRINAVKCVFGQQSVKYLKHTIDAEGIRPTEEKVEAILNIPRPTVVKDLRRFVNMVNYYRRFIPHAADRQGPLQRVMPGNKKNDTSVIQWDEESIRAFDQCKSDIASITYLAHPPPQAELQLVTDASDTAAGGVVNIRIHVSGSPRVSSVNDYPNGTTVQHFRPGVNRDRRNRLHH